MIQKMFRSILAPNFKSTIAWKDIFRWQRSPRRPAPSAPSANNRRCSAPQNPEIDKNFIFRFNIVNIEAVKGQRIYLYFEQILSNAY